MTTEKLEQTGQSASVTENQAATDEELVVELASEDALAGGEEAEPVEEGAKDKEAKAAPKGKEDESATVPLARLKGVQRRLAEVEKENQRLKGVSTEIQDIRERLTLMGEGQNLILDYFEATGQMPTQQELEAYAKETGKPAPTQALRQRRVALNEKLYKPPAAQAQELAAGTTVFQDVFQRAQLDINDPKVTAHMSKYPTATEFKADLDKVIAKAVKAWFNGEDEQLSKAKEAQLRAAIQKEIEEKYGLASVETGATGQPAKVDESKLSATQLIESGLKEKKKQLQRR